MKEKKTTVRPALVQDHQEPAQSVCLIVIEERGDANLTCQHISSLENNQDSNGQKFKSNAEVLISSGIHVHSVQPSSIVLCSSATTSSTENGSPNTATSLGNNEEL